MLIRISKIFEISFYILLILKILNIGSIIEYSWLRIIFILILSEVFYLLNYIFSLMGINIDIRILINKMYLETKKKIAIKKARNKIKKK